MAPEPPTPGLARLRRVLAILAALDDPDARWFAARLATCLTGAFSLRDIDVALGLRSAPGQPDLLTVERLKARNELYRLVARRFFADLRLTPRTYAVRRVVNRYAASAWRNDRNKVTCPHEAETQKALLWQILNLTGGAVLGTSQLFKVLNAQSK